MRREGSPWQGLGTVMLKELADHFDSVRMLLLALLMVLAAAVPLYSTIDQVRKTTAEDPFLLLKLFNPGGDEVDSFSVVVILGFVIPIIAIGLGFDSINGEHNRRTLSRIMSQPIYRDALLAGKFFAGLTVLAVNLMCLFLLVVGLGVLLLGVPPSGEEFARSLVFLVVAIAYGGAWLALAMLFSVLFRSPATAALMALGIWLLMALLWPRISPYIAVLIAPPDDRYLLLGILDPRTQAWLEALWRISPYFLFEEAARTILTPTKSLGPLLDQLRALRGEVVGAALPLQESLQLVWVQIVGLVAGTIVLFVATYVAFQRQEVRA
jgi:ABC-2 type transport system permease protein